MKEFQGKHAIITGGSSGIGLATAQLLASQGAHISIVARSPSKLELAKTEIEAAKVRSEQRVNVIEADVADRDRAEAAMEKAIELGGLPHLLVTSAGIAHPGYFLELSPQIFEETMAVNYFGSLYCVRAVLPAMLQQKTGHLVLISSGAGLIGLYGYTAYSASKFALRGFAESLRPELKGTEVNISIVYPPDTDTPQLAAENKTKPPETKAITQSAETWQPEDVAREILRGVLNKSFAITPGLEMSLLQRLHSAIAPGLYWYLDRLAANARSN
ncbi:SDR family oxidoreductase [Oscillatoriales cyanobacterium LEGE 11467]|uniref:3-dehydrosphinganine reductase n=1 Tax=Zarconia navalis LEGE 11467 TaxID=1828826 RepID=A0A928VZ26_9CYAN|nr:SDR family oxidoreductase [Zarconia navalis]MBE9041462.1 SDR family oxidoreductase [Zarconia navalis LEGE 11467]